MINRLLVAAIALAFCSLPATAPLHAQDVSGKADALTRIIPPEDPPAEPVKQRKPLPESHILDEAQVLDSARLESLSAYLKNSAENDKVKIFLATHQQVTGKTSGELASELRKEWLKDSEIGGVLVFNPVGRTFGISVTGTTMELLEPGTLNTLVQRCKQTLAHQRNAPQTLREATMDLEYEIRSAKTGTATESLQMRLIVRAATALGGLLVLIAAAFLFRFVRHHNYFGKAVLLPIYRMEPRLGATSSGGHSTEADLR
jgi:hypothetical protein